MAIVIDIPELRKCLGVTSFGKAPHNVVTLEQRGEYLWFRSADKDHEVEFGTKHFTGSLPKAVAFPGQVLQAVYSALAGRTTLTVERHGRLGATMPNAEGPDIYVPMKVPARLLPPDWSRAASYLVRLEAPRFKRALDYALVIPGRKKNYKVYDYLHLCGERVFFTDGERVHVTSGFSGFLRDEGFCWHRTGPELLLRALRAMPQRGTIQLAIGIFSGKTTCFEAKFEQGGYSARVLSWGKRQNPLDLDSILPNSRPSFRAEVQTEAFRRILDGHNNPVPLTFKPSQLRSKGKVFIRPQYMLDALRPFRHEATIELHGPAMPVRILGDVSEKFALVMPVQPEKGAVR